MFRVLEGFSDLAHDDEVDACSGALEVFSLNMKYWGYIECLREQAEKRRTRKNRSLQRPIRRLALWSGHAKIALT